MLMDKAEGSVVKNVLSSNLTLSKILLELFSWSGPYFDKGSKNH